MTDPYAKVQKATFLSAKQSIGKQMISVYLKHIFGHLSKILNKQFKHTLQG